MSYQSYREGGVNPIFVIIGVNLLLFIATIISRNIIIELGLWSPYEVFLKYPWGIVTSMFLHDGFFHIFANMFTLYFFGSYLYRLLGSKKFLITYFGGGILGSIFFVLLGTLLNPDSLALAVGASGAVFALGGALSIIRPDLRVFIFPIPVPLPIWVAVIGGFFLLSLLPFVAWQAHLGGLIFGLITGYLFKQSQLNRWRERTNYYF
jgi:membrane associated rhomboid family serine protease|tara:strand:+ start:3649 stop:4269 length:621 start_codon:yes stop_codon:yes gene_type:complete